MKNYKKINIRGTLLDKNQLSKHIEKSASDHIIKSYSTKNTYPVYGLMEDYRFILETYNLLSRHLKLGIKIHSAGEWILDNFYIIEETVKTIQKELTLKKYKNMIGLSNEDFYGFSRVYVLAEELVAFADCKIDEEIINITINSYQKKKLLGLEEFCNLGIFLKISIISRIKELCEKIYSAQIQKYKAENIIERIIEKKSRLKFTNDKYIKINEESLRYPFIEYMSYKLKRYGKKATSYQEILEKEVLKTGLSVSEIIQKEHFNIANIKVTMGNCITSIKEINRINFSEMFSYMNVSEDLLKQDPSGIYSKMDEESKNYYRGIIERKAKKSKISEVYITEKIIELCREHCGNSDPEEQKKSHVGYYLLKDDGIQKLNEVLEIKSRKKISIEQKVEIYIGLNIVIPILFSIYIFFMIYLSNKNILISAIGSIFSLIPISEVFLRIENYIMSKFKKPTMIPKLDFSNGIPKEESTFVVVPTIIKSKEKVEEMFHKLEVYYLANKLDNLYFALLGDCSEEKTQKKDFDEEVISKGIEICEELNKKYYQDGFKRFHFLYRKREWNSSEKSYIGWERKRGLLSSFNKYIKGLIPNDFLTNTLENNNIPDIKYIITLDCDTNLNLGTASKLIGSMSHILNKPIIRDFRVVDGYGIMQPRIGMDLGLAQKTYFVELFSMKGGIDCYTNAISDIYQDYFDEGIFTGKGIYNVDVYNLIMDGEIPENTVLSHDLLEGNYLRCGLLTDIMLLDGYPLKYVPYILRNHRWTRGDWQIVRWLKSGRLNKISKFKIYDNLRRSLLQISAIILLLFYFVTKFQFSLWLSIISISIPFFIDIINYILFKESNINGAVYAYKKFSKELNSIKISSIRIILQIAFLPYEAYKNADSIIRSIYRMNKKTKLLEWVTAEDGEKNAKSDLKSYFYEMKINILLAIITIPFNKLISFLWFLGPLIAWYISLDKGTKKVNIEENKRYLLDIGKRTWSFFEDYINEENNYLMPDNYQEDRSKKIVNRTSSTNIGLELVVVISAYDLGFINYKKCINYLNKIITTICSLSKWNGHLYNWYNTKTLLPLMPRYISTVDSGNFVGYLYIVRNFLENNKNKGEVERNLSVLVESLIDNTDFSKLYSEKNKLFSIGYNLEENKLTDSYYDFLASEARQASLVAIAKGDVPVKHWNNLSRALTSLNGYKGLISWTGTAFEYLMPNINLKRYKGSILDEASKFAIMSQIEYCKKLGVPWGISESAFDLRDLNNNYQYKAFGIPWLGLKRGLEDEIVVSPYSTFLSLEDELELGIENLKKIENYGGLNKYGFYESIDYTPNRNNNKSYAVVKTYMAHHQALILLSINNILNNQILKKRFNNNKEIEATNILLQERMPIQLIITKENKEKITKNKALVTNAYKERIIEEHDNRYRNINVIANENYKIMIDDFGDGLSEYKALMVNRYKGTMELNQGINSFVKSIKTKKIIRVKENAKVVFSPDKAEFVKIENNLKIKETVMIDPNRPIEIRRLEIFNMGNQDEVLEVVFDFEPSMSGKMQDYSHPAFNKLFMRFTNEKDNIIFEKEDRNLIQNYYLVTTLYTENEQIGDFEYEIDREKYYGRENLGLPVMIKEQKNFSNKTSQTIDPIIAMKRTVKIRGKESATINLIISTSDNKEDALENIESLKSEEEIIRTLQLARARVEEESKYLRLNGDKIELFTRLLKYILKLNSLRKINNLENAEINSLWKFGISGDNPIVIVQIRNLEDMYVIEEVIDAFEYYRAKSIFIDLIILNNEIDVYERYVKEAIDEVISNKQIEYLKNISSGIFVLNKDEIMQEDLNVLKFKAKVLIDAKHGGIETYIKDFEEQEEKKQEIKIERNHVDLEIYPLKKDELVFDNSYGGFTESGKEYFIYKNKENVLPSVWSNILANKHFGTLITDTFGGYTWSKNSRLNRLTAWNNDRTIDFPSEVIYIKDENNKIYWTLNSNVVPNDNYYYITHGFGYSVFNNTNDNLRQEVEVFVPNEDSVKILNFRIKNLINEKRTIKIIYYIKTVLGEDEFLSNGNLSVKKIGNIIEINNLFADETFKNRIMYVTSNISIASYTGEKENFFGNGDLLNPDSLYISMNNENGLGKNSCLGIEFKIKLDKLEDKRFNIIIGEASSETEIVDIYQKYHEQENVELELSKTKAKWDDILNIIKIKTPSESINIMMNGWLLYQTLSSRLYARTGYYQSGGAIGFRDQLQDCLGLKFIDSNYLKEQILLCARHQFIEGDVLHWWHNETKKGIRTKFSDDLLWLVYATIEYINFENDNSILDEEIGYLSGAKLNENENERYDLFYEGSLKETLFEHCVRAIENVLGKGIDRFPKIGIGDWNDGFSNIGSKGIGESVWLGMFLYDILNNFIPICKEKNRKDLVEYYTGYKEKLRKNINTFGWDGRWFKRAITDEGKEIGSINSEECRIDGISQSWSVISKIGENDKKFIAISEAENYLIDYENKIVKLFDPPFEKTEINPGYIKSYPPGIRENGGQYTHSSCWMIIAEALLGFGDKAVELAEMINPIEHAKTRDEAKRFKIEPYVIEADLYSNKDLVGQGGWNWYTGSSSWYYKAILEYILGFKIENGYLKIEPCISKNWKEYEIRYKYKTSLYNIKVKNLNGKNTGVETFLVNGEEVKDKKILLQDNCKINNIEISM